MTMGDDVNNVKLGEYIRNSLRGAWEMARANPKAMDYFDLSSDGFWKSFWAIGVMAPVYILWVFFNLQADPQDHPDMIAYPLLSESIFFVFIMPFTAFVMIYFTRFMKISANYAAMVIAFNWVNALVFWIVTIMTIIMASGIIGGDIASIILLIVKFYFAAYVVWFTLKTSLSISGMLAIGVFLFVSLLNASVQLTLLMTFNPSYFDAIYAAINNQPA